MHIMFLKIIIISMYIVCTLSYQYVSLLSKINGNCFHTFIYFKYLHKIIRFVANIYLIISASIIIYNLWTKMYKIVINLTICLSQLFANTKLNN